MTLPLDQLPAPPAVAAEDFTSLRDQAVGWLRELAPDYEPRETDPAVKLIELAAYLRLLLGGRVNDAVRGVYLSSATGADLDQVAAGVNVGRLAGETDAALRRRAQLAWTTLSAAGPRDAYRAHALGVAGVHDAGIDSPAAGQVRVVIVSADADAETATPAALVTSVSAALSADAVRPITDTVTVLAATARAVAVTATLKVPPGPDLKVVEAAATAALTAILTRRTVGRDIPRSALIAALHQPGVDSVALTAPAADVAVAATEVAVAGAVALTMERTT